MPKIQLNPLPTLPQQPIKLQPSSLNKQISPKNNMTILQLKHKMAIKMPPMHYPLLPKKQPSLNKRLNKLQLQQMRQDKLHYKPNKMLNNFKKDLYKQYMRMYRKLKKSAQMTHWIPYIKKQSLPKKQSNSLRLHHKTLIKQQKHYRVQSKLVMKMLFRPFNLQKRLPHKQFNN